jgi:hypothetical protein
LLVQFQALLKRIKVETERVFALRAHTAGAGRTAWCSSCGAARTVVTLPEAAAVAGLSERAVCRRVEARSLHFDEAADGRLLICLDSLVGNA